MPSVPPVPGPGQVPPASDALLMMRYDANKKSALVAYLLWFFVGGLGGHRFYLGRVGSGIVMLIITLLSFLLMIVFIGVFGLAFVGLWLLIDAFLIPGMITEHNNKLISSLREA